MEQDYLGISLKRLNRRSFLLTILVSMLLFVAVGLLFDALYRGIFNAQTSDGGATWVLVPFIVLWWFYASSCTVRRLHDINASGWWSVAIFVPFANLILLIRLFFSKGTADKNKYGQPHTRTHILGLGI
jgi:uncharacterized membrane protein YhaH (DUF805 family)